MTSREIVLANLNHDNPPRPGMNFDGGRMDDFLSLGPGPSRSYTPKRWVDGNKEYYDDEWGNVWARMVGGSVKGEIHQAFLPDWRRLDDMQLPDYDDPSRWEEMRKRFSQEKDKFRLACIGGWIFDNARYLRKLEIYLLDMLMYPDELRRLHAAVARVYEAKIHGAAKAGADGIAIGEDLGTQRGLLFSPATFREYFKDEYTRLMRIAHDHGMKVLMHSCGLNWDLLDDLIACGVDCFQFDQPALYDMPALAEKFKQRKVALWSPVDIQKVLPTGNRQYIESETDRMLQLFRGGLIMKNYPDLPGIGVKPEWDMWAYEWALQLIGVRDGSLR
ncbi:MAG: hypothetical protein NTX50_23105 [Candidatus Sumerlaeota bacterium]|nr:hypothetical protein [Candidatus Sumerlaeota bacterium]